MFRRDVAAGVQDDTDECRREEALEFSRPCHCGIYKPVRAERLLRRRVPLMVLAG